MDEQDDRTSWKLFWIASGAVVTAATVGTPVVLRAGLPGKLIGLAALLALAAVFSFGFRKILYRTSGVFGDVPVRSKPMLLTWVRIALSAHVVWGMAFTLRPAWAVIWLLALAAVGGLEYLVARAQDYVLDTLDPAAAAPSTELATALDPTQPQPGDENVEKIVKVLRDARLGWMTMKRIEPIGSQDEETPWGIRVILRVPIQMAAGTVGNGGGEDRKARKPAMLEVTAQHAEAIAIGMADLTGDDQFGSDWVQINKQRAAGTYAVVIVFRDVLAGLFEYVDAIDPRTGLPALCSIKNPAPVGIKLDGTVALIRLKKHGQAIGATTGGKTSFIHVLIAYITKCPDAVLWVCGAEKLYDLLAGWLDPYLGTDLPLPIDWAACGQADTLEMMAGAMNVARYRQNVPMEQRTESRTVIMIMDEASFVLMNREVMIETPDGPKFATALLADVAKATNSGDVHFIIASQRSTQDTTGDQGPLLSAQLGWGAIFPSGDQAEVGRVVGNHQLAQPRHPGSGWFRDGSEGPDMFKSFYIQSADPSKQHPDHHGLNVRQISESRGRMFGHRARTLEPGAARAAGAAYRNRHTRMTEEFRSYLRSGSQWAVSVEDQEDLPAVVNGGTGHVYDTTMAALDQFVGQVALEAAPGQSDGSAGAPSPAGQVTLVPSGAGGATGGDGPPAAEPGRPRLTVVPSSPVRPVRRSWKVRVMEVFAEAGEGAVFQAGAVVDELEEIDGEEFTPNQRQQVRNTLGALVADQKLIKVGSGYALPPNPQS